MVQLRSERNIAYNFRSQINYFWFEKSALVILIKMKRELSFKVVGYSVLIRLCSVDKSVTKIAKVKLNLPFSSYSVHQFFFSKFTNKTLGDGKVTKRKFFRI